MSDGYEIVKVVDLKTHKLPLGKVLKLSKTCFNIWYNAPFDTY